MTLRDTIGVLRRLEAVIRTRTPGSGSWASIHSDLENAVFVAYPELLRAAEAWCAVLEAHDNPKITGPHPLGTRVSLIVDDYRGREGESP